MKNRVNVSFTKEQLGILMKLVVKDSKNIFGEDTIEEKNMIQELKFGLIKAKGFNK